MAICSPNFNLLAFTVPAEICNPQYGVSFAQSDAILRFLLLTVQKLLGI